jgi:hypothetical protein
MIRRFVYFFMFLSLTACSQQMTRQEFKATLDQMVLLTMSANASLFTETPTPTQTFTPTPIPPTSTPMPSPTPILTPTMTPTPRNVLACLTGTSGANVRMEPSEESQRVSVIPRNQCVTLLALNLNADWARIDRGWVTLKYFNISGPVDQLPREDR